MKRKIVFTGIIIILSAVIFTSCSKTEIKTVPAKGEQSSSSEFSEKIEHSAEHTESDTQSIISEKPEKNKDSVQERPESSKSTIKTVSTVTEKESTTSNHKDNTIKYSEKSDGLILSVTVPKEVIYGQKFVCEATITNTTGKVIDYTIPVYDKNAHTQIRVSIGNENYQFIDCDTYGKGYGNLIMPLKLEPHESFTEKINYLPAYPDGIDFEIDEANTVKFPPGTYEGTAVFYWNGKSGSDKLLLKFKVSIAAPEKGKICPSQKKTYTDNGTSICLSYDTLPEYGIGDLKYIEKANGKKHYFSSDEAKIIVRYLCINALYCEVHFNVDYDYVIHLEGNVVYYNATYGTLGNSEVTTLCGEDKDNFNNILESYDYY